MTNVNKYEINRPYKQKGGFNNQYSISMFFFKCLDVKTAVNRITQIVTKLSNEAVLRSLFKTLCTFPHYFRFLIHLKRTITSM